MPAWTVLVDTPADFDFHNPAAGFDNWISSGSRALSSATEGLRPRAFNAKRGTAPTVHGRLNLSPSRTKVLVLHAALCSERAASFRCAHREEGNLALLRKYSTRISLPVGDSGKNRRRNEVHVESRAPDSFEACIHGTRVHRDELRFRCDGGNLCLEKLFRWMTRSLRHSSIWITGVITIAACNRKEAFQQALLRDFSDLSLRILNEIHNSDPRSGIRVRSVR